MRGGKDVTHAEAIDAMKQGFNPTGYENMRNNGATHKDVSEIGQTGIDIDKYQKAISGNANHRDVMDAYKYGVDVEDYGRARGRWAGNDIGHEKAMLAVDPSYNPYTNIFSSKNNWYE